MDVGAGSGILSLFAAQVSFFRSLNIAGKVIKKNFFFFLTGWSAQNLCSRSGWHGLLTINDMRKIFVFVFSTQAGARNIYAVEAAGTVGYTQQLKQLKHQDSPRTTFLVLFCTFFHRLEYAKSMQWSRLALWATCSR